MFKVVTGNQDQFSNQADDKSPSGSDYKLGDKRERVVVRCEAEQ